jgi:hypothetical protein
MPLRTASLSSGPSPAFGPADRPFLPRSEQLGPTQNRIQPPPLPEWRTPLMSANNSVNDDVFTPHSRLEQEVRALEARESPSLRDLEARTKQRVRILRHAKTYQICPQKKV